MVCHFSQQVVLMKSCEEYKNDDSKKRKSSSYQFVHESAEETCLSQTATNTVNTQMH